MKKYLVKVFDFFVPRPGKKNEKIVRMKKRIAGYWRETAYVLDPKILSNMQKHLSAAEAFLEKGDIDGAVKSFQMAKRELIIARVKKKIYYWRSWRGMLPTPALLFFFGTLLLLILLFRDFLPCLSRLPLLLTTLGGGVGACVAILLQVIDVDPNSEVVSKVPWYGIKPVVGAALGMITYLAVSMGIDLLADVRSLVFCFSTCGTLWLKISRHS